MLDPLSFKLIFLHLNGSDCLVELGSHLFHSLLHDGVGCSQIRRTLTLLKLKRRVVHLLPRLALERDHLAL